MTVSLTAGMDAPELFGSFHICASLILITAAALSAKRASCLPYEKRLKLLSVIGCFLIISEAVKQCYVYYYVCSGIYNYWYIPFQLCSVPMYLCPALPFLKGRIRDACLTFMLGYTFISAAATFIYPQDILRPQLFLTLHGFVWHAALLFISLLIGFSGMADLSTSGFARSVCLFAILCCIAIIINASTETISASADHPHGYANMFYLSPYHSSFQPVISSLEASAGIPAAKLLYAAAITAAAGLTDFVFDLLRSSTR